MLSTALFCDRADAGEQLAGRLLSLIAEAEASLLPRIVYALPRGGIPVAAPIARHLGCPLDIIVAKKITTIQNPELALGAVTSEGNVIWSHQKLWGGANSAWRETALHHARDKANAQEAELSIGCQKVNPQGKLALLVDDGIATGMTIAAAAQALKTHQPAQIWICAPVAPDSLIPWLEGLCDRTVILQTPDIFLSVSRFYDKFPQITTQEALLYLQEHNRVSHQG